MNSENHIATFCRLWAVLLALPALTSSQAQDTATDPPGTTPMVDVQLPNTAIPVILLEYERFTGKRVIRDASIQDKTLSVLTSGKMTYAEAAEFIEKSLLLNGYAIVPTEDPAQVKIIAYNTDKKVSSEGIPVYTSPFQLPETEEVVTYIMPLSYLTPDEAAEIFTNVKDLHSYGKITPLQNASAVVITESSSNIRKFIELRDYLDVSPIKTLSKSIQLERADAEDVAEALIDILELDQESGGSSTPQQPNGRQAQAQQASPNDPNSRLIPSQLRGNSSFTQANAPKPRVRAIPRANRLLVVAAPQDMEYIEGIVELLDAPSENASYMKRKLLYIPVSDFLKIAGDIILRGLGGEGTEAGEISGGNGEGQDSNRNNIGEGGNSNSDSFDSGSSTGSTGNLGNAGSDEAAAPQSIVIDKTLLIADNVQNTLIVSGPPEQLLLISELLDTMDIRPEQIQISAVIAQLNLGDEFEFGMDFIRTLEAPTNGFNGAGTFLTRTGRAQSLLDLNNLTDPENLIPIATQGFTFYGQINPYLDVFLSLLEATDRFRVLQRPTVYTQNNRLAVIETGQRVAVPRSTLSSLDTGGVINNGNQTISASIDYIDVVLKVSVVPLINAEGAITLQIQQKNDSIVGEQIIGGDAVPTIQTQTLGTTVIVEDGGTVLLGGLISEGDQKNKIGIPLFANLPIVGRVFGSTLTNIERQELLIFIQPKIIRNNYDQLRIDQDLIDRTQVGRGAVDFATNEDNNLDVFESRDFNSPETRVHFFRDLFKKKDPQPTARAVPIGN